VQAAGSKESAHAKADNEKVDNEEEGQEKVDEAQSSLLLACARAPLRAIAAPGLCAPTSPFT
jgi:hypothetical protein